MEKTFDVLSYLQDKEIAYWTEGKNVTAGWVNIQCPFCEDHSNHLGINLTGKGFNCWLCGSRGSAMKLVQTLEDCSKRQALGIMARFQEDGLYSGEPLPPKHETASIHASGSRSILPKTATTEFPGQHWQYLISRGYNPSLIVEKYKLMACHTSGKYRFRIIIPIIMNGQIVSFVARDVTGKAEKKYLYCPNSESIIPRRETLYNIDNVKSKTAVIVEGPADVWRIGDGAIATLGTSVSDGQIELLISKGLQKAFVLFDREASQGEDSPAVKLAKALSGLIRQVEILELIDEGDPGEMGNETTSQVRRLLHG
jgi:hypothetical protein